MSSPQLRYAKGSDLSFHSLEGSPALRVIWQDNLCIPMGGVRCVFPLSHPNTHFSVHDANGDEVCLFEDLNELEDESRRAVQQFLDRRYFTPKIEKVESLTQDGGMWLFKVLTSRGMSEFYVRSWRDSSYELKPGRWMIMSVDGKRYEIPDLEALDVRSRQLVEQLW
ncbi:MAG: DUF1854 domain-containing protein [Fimbriimonadaceae bacterium]|nr:DUF1854 domain-containing protein [Fimbriimonadaceae bacterium]